jgi:hypothetical protein
MMMTASWDIMPCSVSEVHQFLNIVFRHVNTSLSLTSLRIRGQRCVKVTENNVMELVHFSNTSG